MFVAIKTHKIKVWIKIKIILYTDAKPNSYTCKIDHAPTQMEQRRSPLLRPALAHARGASWCPSHTPWIHRSVLDRARRVHSPDQWQPRVACAGFAGDGT